MKLTQATTRQLIRATGCTVTFRDGEIIVRGYGGEYFTTDRQDAIDTARAMARGA